VTSAVEKFVVGRLAELQQGGLLREADDGRRRAAAQRAALALGVEFVDASSNDYLGLAEAADVSRETDVQHAAVGAGASRLIHGTRAAHLALEHSLADWVGLQSALLFSTGYAANVGLLSALGAPGSVIVSDRLNHASIIDGCRLSRATTEIAPHLDLASVRAALERHPEAPTRWVVFESCYSMDGDGPDLRALRVLCDELGAGLVVDEAHALGVFGPEGAGRCAEVGVVPDALVGMLGKAVGAHGAFVASSPAMRTLLWNDARSFVFSTAPSPRLAASTLLHVQRARAAEDRRGRLRQTTAQFRAALRERNIPAEATLGAPIIPVIVGDNARALAVVEDLEGAGILAQAIRPPTVPRGSARLRFTVTATWPPGSPARVADALSRALART
jgi:8-amino-7-oxononanoate synthase